jgi:hypothetical protein
MQPTLSVSNTSQSQLGFSLTLTLLPTSCQVDLAGTLTKKQSGLALMMLSVSTLVKIKS